MARVKLTEYRAKKILIGDSYKGISVDSHTKLPKSGRYVAKVDQGIKKRFKLGLVALDQPAAKIPAYLSTWKKKGFSQFLLEPFVPHDSSDERYLSLERVRDGVRLLYAREGGIDIEAHPEKISKHLIATKEDITACAKELLIPEIFLISLVEKFQKHFFAFLEINPLVITKKEVFILDAAVLVDSAGEFFVAHSWKQEDLVESVAKYPEEEHVRQLAQTSASSFTLNVLNPNGLLFFLLSGGGGSIVIADEAAARGAGKEIANYGEYSGGPTQEETYLYTKEVLTLVLASSAQKKALVIAGGVANFTDVQKTFAGIIDALGEVVPSLQKKNVKVFVRRGGPNEEEGLEHMKTFLTKNDLLGAMYGSSAPLTQAIDDAISFVSKKK